MTGVELSAEERAEMRGASEGTIRTLATVGVPAPHHDDTLIAKAAEALAPWLPRPTPYTDDETRALLTENVEHVARAVVDAVRDQIAAEGYAQGRRDEASDPAYADWLDRAEDAKTALLSAIEDVAAMACPGSPPTPLARYAFETAREKALDLLRARAEALGATESDGEGEDGGLGGREAAGPGNRDSGGNE